MSTADLVAIALAAVTLVGVIISWLTLSQAVRSEKIAGAERYGKIEVKVDTLWGFFMRRGQIEASGSGWGSFASPFRAHDDSLHKLRQSVPEIENYFGNLKPGISDLDIAIEIQRHFGEQLMMKFCLPNKFNLDPSLALAVELAKTAIKKNEPLAGHIGHWANGQQDRPSTGL